MDVTTDKEISAHIMFVLKLIGYSNLRNNDPSWLGWSNNENLPVE